MAVEPDAFHTPVTGQAAHGPRLRGYLRFGTRLERKRASHSYGFVLALVFVSLVFTALAPAASWSYATFVLIQGSILCAALWTSALPLRRLAIPMIVTTAVVAASLQLSTGGATTRGAVNVVELVFLVGAVWAIAAGVFDQGEVNSQSVLGALSIYVTLGVLFTVTYSAIAEIGPAPFFSQGTDGDPAVRLYFSFVTLATLGYGDYTPAGDLGRMLAILEALIGQLYLVTIVALLVGNLGRGRREG
jgi:hypothetical protein